MNCLKILLPLIWFVMHWKTYSTLKIQEIVVWPEPSEEVNLLTLIPLQMCLRILSIFQALFFIELYNQTHTSSDRIHSIIQTCNPIQFNLQSRSIWNLFSQPRSYILLKFRNNSFFELEVLPEVFTSITMYPRCLFSCGILHFLKSFMGLFSPQTSKIR